jgi:hypothetical protein
LKKTLAPESASKVREVKTGVRRTMWRVRSAAVWISENWTVAMCVWGMRSL